MMRRTSVPVELEVTSSDSLDEGLYLPDETACQRWADTALLNNDNCVASLQIVTAGEMQQLNNDYRGKDRPTNVLSFPMTVPAEVGINLLGDIAACAEVIAHEAEQQGKTLDAHWAHMIVHGMLHLQGYDHIDDAEAEEMEGLEIKLMQQLGFENPYI